MDHRSDLYSLGVTYYHMLAGHPPFRAETALAVAMKHVVDTPVDLSVHRPDLPPDLCRLVMKLMAKSAGNDRYQSAAEMLRDLNKIRETIQISALAAASGVTLTPPPRDALSLIDTSPRPKPPTIPGLGSSPEVDTIPASPLFRLAEHPDAGPRLDPRAGRGRPGRLARPARRPPRRQPRRPARAPGALDRPRTGSGSRRRQPRRPVSPCPDPGRAGPTDWRPGWPSRATTPTTRIGLEVVHPTGPGTVPGPRPRNRLNAFANVLSTTHYGRNEVLTQVMTGRGRRPSTATPRRSWATSTTTSSTSSRTSSTRPIVDFALEIILRLKDDARPISSLTRVGQLRKIEDAQTRLILKLIEIKRHDLQG